MKLQQLRYIVEVAACGSVTEAARRLFVSQPSVTAAVRDLEREMGITVFERTSKGMVTTTEGQTFLGYARHPTRAPLRRLLPALLFCRQRFCGRDPHL